MNNNLKSPVLHDTAIIAESAKIGAQTNIWHFCHVMDNAVIGTNCSLGQNVMVGPGVTVGSGCKIQNNVSLYAGVTLEDDVFCGPSCVFTNVLTPRAGVERKSEFLDTAVKKGASIGANATIVCGITLGEYCMIAAGAVVTKSVPSHALVAGIPAKKIGWVSRSGDILDQNLVCPRSFEQYVEVDGKLTLT